MATLTMSNERRVSRISARLRAMASLGEFEKAKRVFAKVLDNADEGQGADVFLCNLALWELGAHSSEQNAILVAMKVRGLEPNLNSLTALASRLNLEGDDAAVDALMLMASSGLAQR